MDGLAHIREQRSHQGCSARLHSQAVPDPPPCRRTGFHPGVLTTCKASQADDDRLLRHAATRPSTALPNCFRCSEPLQNQCGLKGLQLVLKCFESRMRFQKLSITDPPQGHGGKLSPTACQGLSGSLLHFPGTKAAQLLIALSVSSLQRRDLLSTKQQRRYSLQVEGLSSFEQLSGRQTLLDA